MEDHPADGAGPRPALSAAGELRSDGEDGRARPPRTRQGGGFYDYPAGGAKQLWPGLREHWPVSDLQPPAKQLIERFLCIQALETARCVEENVVAHPADADLGSILGIGYPAWTGGTLSYIETVGLVPFVERCQQLARRHGARFKPSRWLRKKAAAGERFHPLAQGTGQ
jgi:3-hydroxyacyl-CoA dehydrogenase / enoyl-CoA hydratase / 3-hydroxybutyryl-CoA epimerase